MNIKQLNKLKKFTTATFALWPFGPKADAGRIHSDVVIIGLNPSSRIKFGENFRGGMFDGWYEEGFSKPPFAGAYMTDLISHHEPKSALVLRKWKNAKFKRDNIRNLRRQFKILRVRTTTPIICLGKITNELFIEAFSEYTHVFKIKHPNSYRMKNKRAVFLKNLATVKKEVGKLLIRTMRGSRKSA